MIQPVDALTPKVLFRGEARSLQNPINVKTEKAFALINATAIAVGIGAVMGIAGRSYTSSWRNSFLIGLSSSVLSMLFLIPRFLYKSGINPYAKSSEKDIFIRDKDVQTKIFNDMNGAMDNKKRGLSGKIGNYSKTIVKRIA